MNLVLNQTLMTTVEVVVGALAGALITNIVTRYKERKSIEDKLEELQAQIKENRKEYHDQLAIVRSELMVEIAGLKRAESASLRYTIRNACKESVHKGWIPLDEKSDVLNCYNVYEEIVESNGVVEDCIASMRELGHEPPQNK